MDSYDISDESWDFISDHEIWALPCLDRNLDKAIKLKSQNHKMVVDFLHIDSEDFISKYLDSLDIAFVSTQIEKLESLKKLSASSKKLIVATMGADGSVAFNSGEAFYQRAIPVKKVVDTTGCGDTFQAAFTYTYFKTGMIDKALFIGATEAEKVIHNYGGILNID
jgi:fructoselysine 6-kinase